MVVRAPRRASTWCCKELLIEVAPEEEEEEEEEQGGKSRGVRSQSNNVGEMPPNSSDEEEEEPQKGKGKGQSNTAGMLTDPHARIFRRRGRRRR